MGLLSYLKIAIRIGNTKRVKLPNKAIVIIQCICTVTWFDEKGEPIGSPCYVSGTGVQLKIALFKTGPDSF